MPYIKINRVSSIGYFNLSCDQEEYNSRLTYIMDKWYESYEQDKDEYTKEKITKHHVGCIENQSFIGIWSVVEEDEMENNRGIRRRR